MKSLFRIRPTARHPISFCLTPRPLPPNVLLQRRSFSTLRSLLPLSSDENVNSLDPRDIRSNREPFPVLTDIRSCKSESIAITNTDGTDSVAIPIHDTFPASLGLMTVQGYVEFIKPGTELPYSKRRKIKPTYELERIPKLSICGRLHKYGLRIDIAEQDISEFYADTLHKNMLGCRIELQKDLTGTLTLKYLVTDYRMKRSVLQFDAARLTIDGHSSSEVKLSKPGDYMLIDQRNFYTTKWNMPFKTVF